ncbi:MAG: BlaI family penicillinase repressor [Candidatus Paceibacteria bacterium]|jgi:BlaI family penicillinase repressor
MTSQHTLGELQLAIMRVLWKLQSARVAEVHEALPERHSRALTTIATMLSKMEKKGVVCHHSEGRQFIYEPTVTESEVKRSMVSDLAQRLFEGDFSALVSHLIEEKEIDAAELDALKQRIADHEQGAN